MCLGITFEQGFTLPDGQKYKKKYIVTNMEDEWMKSELLSSVQVVAEFMPPKENDIDFLKTAVSRKAETD